MKNLLCLTLMLASLPAAISSAHAEQLRIVLVGKSGAGKSATGNTILGRDDAFKEDSSFESVTRSSSQQSGDVRSKHVVVVDTPGLYDTSKTEDDLKREIERCVNLSVPGPHVFLLVIRLGVRFTAEEDNAVKWIQKNFGERAAKFTMVLFTHADVSQGKKLENEFNTKIDNLIQNCGGGYHAFNNKEREDMTQVDELLTKIDTMVEKNGGEFYTNAMYQEAQRKLKEEEERRKKCAWLGKVTTAIAVTLFGSANSVIAKLTGVVLGTYTGQTSEEYLCKYAEEMNWI